MPNVLGNVLGIRDLSGCNLWLKGAQVLGCQKLRESCVRGPVALRRADTVYCGRRGGGEGDRWQGQMVLASARDSSWSAG
jgi:hypothetical protein